MSADPSRTDGGRAVTGAVQSGIARNTLLNILGLGVPLVVAFLVMPIAAHHLGVARFGLLGLAWALSEYLTLFDLGLARATVKFVADSGNSEELSETASLATIAQIVAGVIGGVLFFFAARPIVDIAFPLPKELVGEAVRMFQVVGLSLPVILLLSALRAILEGVQRFDLSNSIRAVSSSASVAIPAIGAALGASLPTILLWVLGSRLVISVVYLTAIRSAVPALVWKVPRRLTALRKLLSFGGWAFVSSAVGPLLVYFDRFSLAAIAGVAAVGFYTAPYEAATRFSLLPIALIGSLYPALTVLERTRDRTRLNELVASSGRSLAVVMVPPLAVVVAFAPDLLAIWLGVAYAEQATTALRTIALGVLMNALAHPLFISLYAMNRPDLPAKFHLVELIIHLPLTVVLVRAYGISGAATAWTVRVTLDFLLLMAATSRITGMSVTEVTGGRFARMMAAGLGLLGMLLIAATVGRSQIALAAAITIGSLAAFMAVSWLWILEDTERRVFARLLPHLPA